MGIQFKPFSMTRCRMNSKKGCHRPKKLITRLIMPETSPNSPHITLTHPKSRFDHFWDPPQPPSWSKLAICAKSGVVFLSGQESNPKVHGYREKFNIGNVANFFLWSSIHVGSMPFHFWKDYFKK